MGGVAVRRQHTPYEPTLYWYCCEELAEEVRAAGTIEADWHKAIIQRSWQAAAVLLDVDGVERRFVYCGST